VADFEKIKQNYTDIAVSYEGMLYKENEFDGWTSISRNFVFNYQNPKTKTFLKTILTKKSEEELKMKYRLDKRILQIKEQKQS
jgi:hypothetical protein